MPAVLTLDQPVTNLSGVGPQYAERLERLGVRTLRDLLLYFPFRYVDYSRVTPIGFLRHEQETTVRGHLSALRHDMTKRTRKPYVGATVSDGTGQLSVYWFYQRWIYNKLQHAREVFLAGRAERDFRGSVSMMNPLVEVAGPGPRETARIVPIYHETEGLTSRWLNARVRSILSLADEVEEFLPGEVLARRQFPPRPVAIRRMHDPESMEAQAAAQQRFDFEEMFLLQLAGQLARRRRQREPAQPIPFDESAARAFVAALPFQLTNAQRRAAWDILRDLAKPMPMNRLLEGDVGSGKTVVAAMAMHHAAQAGFQAVLLAPTEILAVQHGEVVERILRVFGLDVGLLLGSTPARQRGPLLEALADGRLPVVVGTHALIEESVRFHRLALVIVDEQHRFGVAQREALVRKGARVPHFLSMTATPIPRTLARTAFADLDISVLDEMPPGRPVVETRLVGPDDRTTAYRLVAEEIRAGRQAFCICPLIEESDKLGVRSAIKEAEKLKEVFPDLRDRIGLLHGRLKPPERESVMTAFQRGEVAILVATTVIEVGIDIPNATVMLVEDAERFGLAQLHQLRGRVGRGQHQAYCLLFTDIPDERTQARLQTLVRYRNGFDVAEADLEERGMGDLYGVSQHGRQFRVANLLNSRLISDAQTEAAGLVERDPELSGFPGLRRELAAYSPVHLVGD